MLVRVRPISHNRLSAFIKISKIHILEAPFGRFKAKASDKHNGSIFSERREKSNVFVTGVNGATKYSYLANSSGNKKCCRILFVTFPGISSTILNTLLMLSN